MERAPAAEASHGRSGELPARPVDGTECVLFRRRGAGGQQRVGTGDEARGAEPQELALRGQPARRKNRGDSGQPGLDLPPPPGGSAALLHATAPEPAAAVAPTAAPPAARTAWLSRPPGSPTSGNGRKLPDPPLWESPLLPPCLSTCTSRIAHDKS